MYKENRFKLFKLERFLCCHTLMLNRFVVMAATTLTTTTTTAAALAVAMEADVLATVASKDTNIFFTE